MKTMKTLIYIVLVFAIVSCKSEKSDLGYIVIDLAKDINSGSKKGLMLNDIAKQIKLIPVETNDSALLAHLIVVGKVGNDVIIRDNRVLYSTNRETGKIKTLVNSMGQGPEEYNNIHGTILNDDNTLYIYDFAKRGFLQFGLDGKYKSFFRKDAVQHFAKTEEGYHVAAESGNMETCITVYDENWNLVRKGIPNFRKDAGLAMHYMNRVYTFNGHAYFKDALGDTLYHVTAKEDKPFIVLSKGRYKAPLKILSSLDEMNKESHNYIMQDYCQIAGNYGFVSFYYNNATYSDICDLNTSKLLYRNIAGHEDEKPEGIPVEINNQIVNTWPSFVQDNIMYCVIDPVDALKLIPSLPKDTNPILLEVELK